MQEIQTQKIQGFYCNEDCMIYDKNGLWATFKKGVSFNMPAGKYRVLNGMIAALRKPVKYPAFPLVKPEKPANTWHNINLKTYFEPNPNKVSIDIAVGDIVIDADYWESLNTPQMFFTVLHELGHFFYGVGAKPGTPEFFKSENACDTLAAFRMLRLGFNPKQIAKAIERSLSDYGQSYERKLAIYNTMLTLTHYPNG